MKQTKSRKNTLGRREFLATMGAGAAIMANPFTSHALVAEPMFPAPFKARSSDRMAAAVIGLGGRGSGIAEWQVTPYADVVAICDVDLRRTRPVAENLARVTGRKVDIYQDYRRLLERKDIQVICNATPEHWHTKINIDACRAGKDVYCEKPLTLTVDEGKILRGVVRETGRIVQVGTQQRSGPQFQIVCSLVRGGRIGRLRQIAVYVPGGNIGPGELCKEEAVPRELDWNMWSGQAPLNPYCVTRFRGPNNWSDYGGGLVTNWGAHHMDIAHWAMGGEEVGPLSVEARGYSPNFGKPGYPDRFYPFAAKLKYPGDIELWFLSTPPDPAENKAYQEVIERIYGIVPDHIRNYKLPDRDDGVLFIGENGSMTVGRNSATGEGIGELDKMPLSEDNHLRWRACLYAHTFDLLNCIRSRQQPVSDPAGQHRSQLPCHLINIALRLGRKLSWDAQNEKFTGDDEANAYLQRPQREPYSIK